MSWESQSAINGKKTVDVWAKGVFFFVLSWDAARFKQIEVTILYRRNIKGSMEKRKEITFFSKFSSYFAKNLVQTKGENKNKKNRTYPRALQFTFLMFVFVFVMIKLNECNFSIRIGFTSMTRLHCTSRSLLGSPKQTMISQTSSEANFGDCNLINLNICRTWLLAFGTTPNHYICE